MTDSDSGVTDGRRPTRRRVLALTAVGATGLAGFATAQGQEGQGPEQTQQGQDQPAETFRLGGEVQGWQGQQPQEIQGQTNPPLALQPGQMYELTWENLDGQPHNFAFRNEQGDNLAVILPAAEGTAGNATAGNATGDQAVEAEGTGNQTTAATQNETGGAAGGTGDSDIQIQPGGDTIDDPQIGGPQRGNRTGNETGVQADDQTGVATDNQTGAAADNQTGNATAGGVQVPPGAISQTETVREQGATQTFRFVATQEMATYICPIHPTTMEGPVRIQQQGQEEEGDAGTGQRPEPQPQE